VEAEKSWGNIKVRLLQGDITAYDGDAVVNAANSEFWMGSGVAGAIKRAGGEEIEREAMAGGPLAPGGVRVTTAGRLDARFVLHAAVMAQDLVTSEAFIRLATGNALRRAEEIGAIRIAFPALGTGVGGFPHKDCARAMLGEIQSYLAARPKTPLREIAFFLFGQESFGLFRVVLEDLDGRTAGGK
jgi:O-acetyl-ADP-ribose deacetylase (regulator of RNase III)